MKIKTFPLHFVDTELEEIREIAKVQNMTMKDFIMEAIEEKISEIGEK